MNSRYQAHLISIEVEKGISSIVSWLVWIEFLFEMIPSYLKTVLLVLAPLPLLSVIFLIKTEYSSISVKSTRQLKKMGSVDWLIHLTLYKYN